MEHKKHTVLKKKLRTIPQLGLGNSHDHPFKIVRQHHLTPKPRMQIQQASA